MTDHQSGAHRSIALLSFRDGVDPAGFLTSYAASAELAADVLGFDVGDILDVEDLLLDPVARSSVA